MKKLRKLQEEDLDVIEAIITAFVAVILAVATMFIRRSHRGKP